MPEETMRVPLPDKQVGLVAVGLHPDNGAFRTYDMLQIAALADSVGFRSADVWGFGLFETAMTVGHDDPWLCLQGMKRALPHTARRAALHARTLVGGREVPRPLVDRFIALAVKNGVDEFAVFDEENRLSDSPVFLAAVASGKPVVAVLRWDAAAFPTAGALCAAAAKCAEAGAASVALADVGGTMTPTLAFNAVRALKEGTSLPVEFGCTNRSGLANLCAWEAVRAGADALLTVFSCLFGADSYPSSESIAASLEYTPADTHMPLPSMIDVNTRAKEALPRLQQAPARAAGPVCPDWSAAEKLAEGLARSEEDVMLCALFPESAPDFLRYKYALDV